MGIYWDTGKKMKTAVVYWGYIGIMDKKMEAIILHWGNIGAILVTYPKLKDNSIQVGTCPDRKACGARSDPFTFPAV